MSIDVDPPKSIVIDPPLADMYQSTYDPDADGIIEEAQLKLITIASADVMNSNDAEKGYAGSLASYTKAKEIKVLSPIKGTMRITYEYRSVGVAGSYAYFELRKNGVAWGAERSTDSGTYLTSSEDLSVDLSAGDLIQIYYYGYYPYIRNFRLCYLIKIEHSNTLT